MKKLMKKLLRPVIFTAIGALVGLGYYYAVGCSTGTCAITSSPLSSMVYVGLIGLVLSGAFGSSCCCSGGSCER